MNFKHILGIKHPSLREGLGGPLPFLIGILASLAANMLHQTIHWIQQLLVSDFSSRSYNWMFLVFPIVGIWLTMLFVKYVVKDNISHGITRILYAISTNKSYIKAHNMWTSMVASALTIGFGGSVGAEAPIVLTGSAIGSNLGRFFGMDRKTLMVLVGCGGSAAIAGIFKAPIAGMVFTLEVLMVDLSMASLMPILISSVTAAAITYILQGNRSLFDYNQTVEWGLDRLPSYILLGVFCGFISLYFIRSMSACESVYARLKNHRYAKLFLGGILLSSLIFFFPSLYGEGYIAINQLLATGEANLDSVMVGSPFAGHSELLFLYLSLVILFKPLATASTNGAGGCGGTFAPSLFIGGFAGFLFSHFWNYYSLGVPLSEANFTMLGMAAVMAGVMHAPLTGIFLIAELTGGYSMFMPLMIVSVVSVLIISLFERYSIYALRLAREGKLLTHHTDKSVLTLMSLESVIEHSHQTINPDMPLGQLVGKISTSQTDYLPVCDKAGHLLGEIDINDIRHVIFRTELYDRFTVAQVMKPAQAVVGENDPMDSVMQKFQDYNARYLPVVTADRQLKGYISRTRVLTLYRNMVADFSTE